MQGKYDTWVQFILAKIYRYYIRTQIQDLVRWQTVEKNQLEDGCTALIGMCSRLPQVLKGNILCLYSQRWSALKRIFIVVDNKKGCLSDDFQRQIMEMCPELEVCFFYYNEEQYQLSQKLQLPYIFSWLSWCIGISNIKTKTVLLHDYDALILNNHLENRYQEFIESEVKIQGISCYKNNGFQRKDFLATTFEAFIDVAWVKSFRPIQLFNDIDIYQNRSVDYDTLLYLQARQTDRLERQITPVKEDDLVHPTQMIHQYTMFQKFPQKSLPCYSIIMIPFFSFLSGNRQAFRQSVDAMEKTNLQILDFLNDSSQINFSQLTTLHVDWALKQIIHTFLSLKIEPFRDLIDYGNSLYSLCKTPSEQFWLGDFSPSQRQWINVVLTQHEPLNSSTKRSTFKELKYEVTAHKPVY